MRKKWYFWTLLAVLLLVTALAFAQQTISEETYKPIAAKFLTAMQQKDFTKAAGLFHYPTTYTADQLKKDRDQVKIILEIINGELGEVREYKISKTQQQCYFISVAGGDVSYWSDKPSIFALQYEVVFAKEKEGFLILGFSNFNNTNEISYVNFALAASREGSKARIDGITKALLNLAEKTNEKK